MSTTVAVEIEGSTCLRAKMMVRAVANDTGNTAHWNHMAAGQKCGKWKHELKSAVQFLVASFDPQPRLSN